MAFVTTATLVGGWALGTGVAAGIGSTIVGGALIGAGVGGAYSAFTGQGDILDSMLTGALIGGAGAGIGSAAGIGATAPAAGGAGGAGGLSTVAVPSANVGTVTAANALAPTSSGLAAGTIAAPGAAAPLTLTGAGAAPVVSGIGTVTSGVAPTVSGLSGMKALGYGLAGTSALQLLGDRKVAGAGAPTDPGMLRPFDYSSTLNEPTGNYPSPYATASYDASGNPIMDTRERNYFNQGFAALQPYSAKTGTANPNIPLPTNIPVNAARGGIMGEYDDEAGNDDVGQGNMQRGLAYAHGGVARFADKGMVDEEAELRKTVMKNLKRLNPEQMQNVMGSFQEEGMREKQFLMKNMPNYAESMRPTVSGMVEGAQYGDRMAQSYGGQPRDINLVPTMIDPQSGMYGGIASIGRQIDPNTRVNLMADLQSTPYDRNTLDAVRRVGAGVDRKLSKDSNLSAFYEQDQTGLNKSGGVRYTKNFALGGIADMLNAQFANSEQRNLMPSYSYNPSTQTYSGPGISTAPSVPAVNLPPLAADLVTSLTPQYQAANPYKFAYDPNNQKYSAAVPNMGQLQTFKADQDRVAAEAAAAAAARSSEGYAMGGNVMGYGLGGYSDGGRLLRGPGDGVSDSIPATIAGKQPARLADGEFVIPARIVSEIGNGSTDAGAKRLYAMMDRIQAGRKKTIGKKNVAKDTKAKKHLLA
jgi:hypothetical protein